MLVHLSGQLVPHDQARVSVFDRGFLFGDGVYEGLRAVAWDGEDGGLARSRAIGMDLHIARLASSLAEARFETGAKGWDPASLTKLTDELLAANNLRDAFVYWQVTRGAPGAGQPFRMRLPASGGMASGLTVLGFCGPQPSLEDILETGPVEKRIALIRDPRWEMGHLKSTSLMGNCLAAIDAGSRAGGCDEAIFIRNGLVVEGLATNVIIVTERGELVTPSLESAPMLAGVTRAILLDALGDELVTRPVKAAELLTAREVMLTGSSTMVASVTHIDGQCVGGFASAARDDGAANSRNNPIARRLLRLLVDAIRTGDDMRIPDLSIRGKAFPGFNSSTRPPQNPAPVEPFAAARTRTPAASRGV